ncbi:MAG: hypothetical protein HY294_03385 [Candidatus Rokubacteria bacterium]|nr:hypothetical protein [Candidatus Rokubacteria bacterium]MBI3825018.1 hypothetical protein [Candidatus Rokubacteria bacterium]
MDDKLDQRLAALEVRLGRLESLLGSVSERLERGPVDPDATRQALQAWVTDYVTVRLQQLVPERCEHDDVPPPATAGPVLPGTRVRCTEEVIHRLHRIPIPFVRQMVTQKVAETASAERVAVVDVAFFERAATF